jgi:hypothetical protein
MPKKWLKNWPLTAEYDEAERDHYIKTIGNHTLLNSSLNTSISNSEWSTKLNGNSKGKGLKQYAQGLVTINPILQLKEWNEEEILNRANWLSDKINKVWISYIANNPSSANSGSSSSIRRPSLNFFEMGLNVGDKLVFTEDQSKIAEISGPKTIDFEGETGLSLTALSQKLRGSNTRQPCQWWSFNGRNLSDIYDETYPVVAGGSTSVVEESNTDEAQHETTLSLAKVETAFSKDVVKISRSIYKTTDNKIGFVLSESRSEQQGDRKLFWYGLSIRQQKAISEFDEQYQIFVLKGMDELLIIPLSFIVKVLPSCNASLKENGDIRHWHIKIFHDSTGNVSMLLSKPYVREISLNKYIVK